jgi:hypothetical protein
VTTGKKKSRPTSEACIRQHDIETHRTSFSEKSATNREKSKTTEKMCCCNNMVERRKLCTVAETEI